MPFKKGVSGNPNGTKTRKHKQLADLLRMHVTEACAVLVKEMRGEENALPAAKEILDRVYGKAQQMVDVNNTGGPLIAVIKDT